MEIKQGAYQTRDGTIAFVWEWGKNMLGEECWVGTVRGGGLNCWDKEGRDLSGTRAWDLVHPAMREHEGEKEMSEEKNPRETQFAGFAKLLYEELARNVINTSLDGLSDIEAFKQEQCDIIARRAYDLACHILYETAYGMDLFNIRERVTEIPDMTAWPEGNTR